MPKATDFPMIGHIPISSMNYFFTKMAFDFLISALKGHFEKLTFFKVPYH
jgi:hypothetical protein